MMKNIDVTKDGARIVQVIEEVLKNVALRVLAEGVSEPETPVSMFIAILRDRPNMFFVN